MHENINLEIKYFGRIHYANLNLNKINIVGGINSSGKSTASKLLYCFLKANSVKRIDYVKQEVIPLMNIIISIMKNPESIGDDSIPVRYTIDDDFSDILNEYNKAKKLFLKNKRLFELEHILEEMIKSADNLIRIIRNDKKDINAELVKLLLINENLSKFKGIANLTGDYFKCSIIIGEDFYYKETNYNFKYYLDFPKFEHFKDFDGYYSSFGSFDFLTDVFYLDSFSIFDMKFQDPRYMEHIQYLITNLKDDSDTGLSEEILHVQEKIDEIIKGHFNSLPNEFSFEPDDGYTDVKVSEGGDENIMPRFISTDNTSSGIKQLGVIQMLLENHKLKPGTFLIIDEPEVNLHPEWQFKFAEVLVLLAKELDVIIYLNSHSPMFIESMDAFCEYYDFEDSINFYLTQESQKKGEFSFKPINSDELYKLYDNLGKPYDLIDELRLKKRLGD